MADLPARPDLDQLRHQAKDLLHAAQRGDSAATARIRVVSDQIMLSTAQLALAREYGFASWAKLKLEVERRGSTPRMVSSARSLRSPRCPDDRSSSISMTTDTPCGNRI